MIECRDLGRLQNALCHENIFQGGCLRMERACVATRRAAREARDAANTDVFARSATWRAALLVATRV
ncbi:hypothetical protein P355_3354 [Burkholderia cenocepacia KC-01]|nr:hypothetical protein P355_3354 [Burkholderia cenocepacia KC-01]